MEKLKPCPFCNAEAMVSHESEGVLVRCQKCGATSGWIDEYYEAANSGEQKAVKLWNRRAVPENKSQAIEDANELIRGLICEMEPNQCDYCDGKSCETCRLCTENDEDDCNFSLAIEN